MNAVVQEYNEQHKTIADAIDVNVLNTRQKYFLNYFIKLLSTIK